MRCPIVKWILLLVVLVVIGVALYVRTVRSAPAAAPAQRSHRLDDAATSETPQAAGPDTFDPEARRPGDDEPLAPGGRPTT